MKLATKFMVLMLLGILALIGSEGYLAVRREIAMLDRDMQSDAERMSGGLTHFVGDTWEDDGEARALELLKQADLAAGPLDMNWVWLDATEGGPHDPMVDNSMLKGMKETFTTRHTDDKGNLLQLTYTRVAVAGPRLAAIEMIEPVTHNREMLRVFAKRMVMLTCIALLMGSSLVMFMGARLVGRPLALLVDKTRRIGRGDFSGPIELESRDEFGELATSINTMCDQLQDAQQQIDEAASARVAALEQLRHADRLRTVGRLASGIAHELGTPLNVVGGRAGMIASGRLSPEETRESAEVIKAESERITSIVRQLLDFARRSTPQRAPADMRQLVDQTLDLLAPLAEKRRVSIRCVAGDEVYPCRVDAGQMRQVLTNLVVNAVQSMPDGGDVEVDVRRERRRHPDESDAREHDFLAVAVRDQGRGISEEDRQQLFEPFFTTKDVGEGTGLGLSIAYGIVQEHGGWIDVESRPGAGSRFTFYVPLEAE